jgi:uncharacterized protein (TIRG00374 family)
MWLLGIAVSAALLTFLYRAIDLRLVGSTLRQADPLWLVFSVGFIAPLTAIRAWRFMLIVPPDARPGFGEAVRMTLVAGTFNMFMPAKTGDLVKSVVIARHRGATRSLAVAVVVWERLADLFALLLWSLVGILAGRTLFDLPSGWWIPIAVVCAIAGALVLTEKPTEMLLRPLGWIRIKGRTPRLVAGVLEAARGWPELHRELGRRRTSLVLLSVGLWFLQLSQIWMFAVTLHVAVPFTTCVSLAAAALMAGQLPLTFGGIGARDLALVVLFADYASPETAAAMGLLTATRSFVPSLAGLFVMKPHLAAVVDAGRGWQRQ